MFLLFHHISTQYLIEPVLASDTLYINSYAEEHILYSYIIDIIPNDWRCTPTESVSQTRYISLRSSFIYFLSHSSQHPSKSSRHYSHTGRTHTHRLVWLKTSGITHLVSFNSTTTQPQSFIFEVDRPGCVISTRQSDGSSQKADGVPDQGKEGGEERSQERRPQHVWGCADPDRAGSSSVSLPIRLFRLRTRGYTAASFSRTPQRGGDRPPCRWCSRLPRGVFFEAVRTSTLQRHRRQWTCEAAAREGTVSSISYRTSSVLRSGASSRGGECVCLDRSRNEPSDCQTRQALIFVRTSMSKWSWDVVTQNGELLFEETLWNL